MDSIVVFSHLRWEFVYQRPQHLMSRLARQYRIVFIEEPEYADGPPEWHISTPIPNLTVCRPTTPVASPGFHDDQISYLRPMVRELGTAHRGAIAWLYTPMALPLLEELDASCVAYDCMDELSLFKNPPPHLVEYEDMLLKTADIVFTGGPSIYHAKKHRNANVHCFPSSVDVHHFRRALSKNIAHPLLRELPAPRLGFYGVIDERFDPGLIEHMADKHPEWQLVLVGPVVKIDPDILPRRPNIHYMGQQPYSALPQFLAGWDVCLMPFALNDATRFISPTKSLEYMAAELPVVSTGVKDVVDLHGDVVEIANGPADFAAACERALAMPDEEKRLKIRVMRDKLSRTSWNATAAKMHELLAQLDKSEAPDIAEEFWHVASMRNAAHAAGARE